MNAHRLSARPALRWLLALLAGGLVALLGVQGAAAADNTLVSSTPTDGSTVDSSPGAVSLTFTDQLGTNSRITAVACGPAGEAATPVTIGNTVLLSDRVTLTLEISTPLPKGVCTVTWQVTDISLQPAGTGSISFTVANDPAVTTTAAPTTTVAGATVDPAATTTTAAVPATTVAPTGPGAGGGTSTATTEDRGASASGPLGLFRLLSNLGLAVLFGSLVVIAMAWPEGVEYLVTVRFLRITWILTLVASALFAGALANEITGNGLGSSLLPTAWGDLLDTRAGTAALARVLLVAASAYVMLRPERAIDPTAQLPALGVPGLAVATIAFSRDAFGALELGVGLLHSLSMAVWLGGLVLLVQVVLSGPGEEDLVHAVRGFGRLSTPALAVTVLTGVVQMFRLDRGAIFSSNHGLVLIVKALFVALMVFVALEARRFISQRASRAHAMSVPLAARLRRALRIETGIGVVVLLFTAWLLALTPQGLAGSGGSAYDLGPVYRFTNSALGTDVGVAFSEEVGTNDVRIEVFAPASGLSGLAVDFIAPPGSGIGGMTIHTVPLSGAGVAVLPKSAGFTLSVPGTWTVIVRVGTSEVGRANVLIGGDTAPPGT